jgi:hypothetical protein
VQDFTQCSNFSTNLGAFTIKDQAITTLFTKTLTAGQSAMLTVVSDFTNNGFINLTYNNFSPTSDSEILFYAQAPTSVGGSGRVYDMTFLNSVLLPNSNTLYNIYLTNVGTADISYNILASGAISLLTGIFSAFVVLGQLL